MSAISVNVDPGQTQKFRAAGLWRDETLAGWIGHWAGTTPTRPALIASDGILTYAELQASARRVAAALRGLGIGRGDVIAAQLPNGRELVVLYLAAGYCGAVLQTIHMP